MEFEGIWQIIVVAGATFFAGLAAVAVPWLQRRKRRSECTRVFGVPVDMASLKKDPELVEKVRDKICGVGLLRVHSTTGSNDSDQYSVVHTSFAFLSDGSTSTWTPARARPASRPTLSGWPATWGSI